MDKRVTEVIDGIYAGLKELATLTEAYHISAYLIGGNFHIIDYTDLNNKKFDIHKTEENNE